MLVIFDMTFKISHQIKKISSVGLLITDMANNNVCQKFVSCCSSLTLKSKAFFCFITAVNILVKELKKIKESNVCGQCMLSHELLEKV